MTAFVRTNDPLTLQALQSLAPGTQWALRDVNDITTLTWLDASTQPTLAALQAEMTRIAALPLALQAISALQLRVAMVRANKLSSVVTWIGTQSAEVKERWGVAHLWPVGSPLLGQMVAAGILTQADVASFFNVAQSIPDIP